MKVEQLTREHIEAVQFRQYERDDLGTVSEESIEYFLKAVHKYALVDNDGNVVAVMGGNVKGINCHTWMLASELMYQHPVATLKLILRMHKEGVEQFGVKRFYTFNLPHHKREILYLESIGYRPQGQYNNFKDGKERILFVKELE